MTLPVRVALVHDRIEQNDGAERVLWTPSFHFPFGAHIHTNLEPTSQRYVEGLYDVYGSPPYVNRGIGTPQFPVRIGSRPEITQFKFHAA